MAGMLAPALEVGGSLASSAAGFISAERQMKFQREMASSQHQREVKDLRAAGLNPILSGMGGTGAAAPSGVMFTPDNPARGLTQAISLATQTAANVAQIGENMKTMVTQQALNSAAAARETAQALVNRENIKKVFAETKTEWERRRLTSAQVKKLGIEKRLLDLEEPGKKAESEIYDSKWGERIPLIDRILRILNEGKKLSPPVFTPKRRW